MKILSPFLKALLGFHKPEHCQRPYSSPPASSPCGLCDSGKVDIKWLLMTTGGSGILLGLQMGVVVGIYAGLICVYVNCHCSVGFLDRH